ncbi:O-succinylbenzoic acid-CoA ligase [Vibrio maritimus]|uniref:O-succinylbenzoic acid-CoA ligase n=1 Tax=Vibrio maritimus TaxID=990268 RepID=A0A090RX04_9VIBR|nr:O-succinylbenzoic acid-CoA ligase [Vibrio maritimus]
MGYGMTETASTVTAKRVDSHLSSGYLLPRRVIKVESERIYVAGDTLAAGYYVQGALRQLELVDGWFDTKDLGRWSEQGELVVVGRADNLFISGGENVHCEEVEAALNQLSDISQSIVVPVVDTEFGTRCIAVVHCDNLPTVNAMNDILRPHLPKFKHPIGYVQMPEHLLSSGIKVSRKAVKTWLRSAQSDFIVIS